MAEPRRRELVYYCNMLFTGNQIHQCFTSIIEVATDNSSIHYQAIQDSLFLIFHFQKRPYVVREYAELNEMNKQG